MRKTFLSILSVCCFLTSIPIHANTWLQQRWQFKDAHQAVLNNDLDTFKRLSAQLSDYPIAHYLRYLYLEHNIGTEKAETLQAFLEQYKESLFVQPLRQAWLTELAKKRDWKTYLAAYTPQKDTLLRCYYLQAHINTQGHLNGLIDEAKNLWLVGHSQPDECDPAFNYLYQDNLITSQLRWQRIRFAMAKGNLRLARYLARGLSKPDQQLLAIWQSVYQNPARELKRFKQSDSSIVREIVQDGLQRLSREDAATAYDYFHNDLKQRYAFTDTEKAELLRYIALKGVRQNIQQAALWLEEIEPNLVDDKINHAKLQLALAQQDWQRVITQIQSLPEAEQAESQWQYWQARALEETGQTEEAEKQFGIVSPNRDYYGFLAADRLGKAYSFQSQPMIVSQEEKDQLLEKQAGMIRARELYFVGLTALAREEWQAVLPKLTKEELKAAAALAHQWGWHDRAIAAIYKSGHHDDLKIRFPLPFYDPVLKHAQNQQLDFAYVYALIRQESAFQTDAISVAGALGLMQLMPATAKKVANQHKIRLKNLEELFVPDININFGTSYIRDMLDKFNGNRLLATAAYNAGPERAQQWGETHGCLPADIWVELIPFNETRNYVKRVLSYIPVFEHRMVGHQQVKPMPLEAIQAKDCSS